MVIFSGSISQLVSLVINGGIWEVILTQSFKGSKIGHICSPVHPLWVVDPHCPFSGGSKPQKRKHILSLRIVKNRQNVHKRTQTQGLDMYFLNYAVENNNTCGIAYIQTVPIVTIRYYK